MAGIIRMNMAGSYQDEYGGRVVIRMNMADVIRMNMAGSYQDEYGGQLLG